MKYIHGTRVKVIEASSGFDFESRLNSTLLDFDEKGVSYDLQLDLKAGFKAYIIYETTQAIPETLADRHELESDIHYCSECPYYERPYDGRVKYTKCWMAGERTFAEKRACDIFYKNAEAGLIKQSEVKL